MRKTSRSSLTCKAPSPVKGCRTVKKADMIHNDLQPNITVDAQTYEGAY